MRKFKRYIEKKLMGENGFTLVEVLASVVLLTIIITIFLNVFIKSAETSKTSGEIIDATYMAQIEMEHIYLESLSTKYSDRVDAFQELEYDPPVDGGEWIIFEKETDEGYYLKVKLQRDILDENENMNRLIVAISHTLTAKRPQATMEGILLWKADSE